MESFALPNARFSHVRCGACPIREHAVCAYANGDELSALDGIKSYRDYAAGRDILSAGVRAPMVGSIVRGVVKLTKSLPDGRAQMVGLLFPGDFVGHPSRAEAEFDATAATDVTLCLFQRAPFESLMRGSHRLEQRMLDMTLTELDAAREWLLLLGRKTARERLSSFLLMLARRAALTPGDPLAEIALPLTRGEMAAYLGRTIETVSRHMTRLRADGVIGFDTARSVRVPSIARLEEEAGD